MHIRHHNMHLHKIMMISVSGSARLRQPCQNRQAWSCALNHPMANYEIISADEAKVQASPPWLMPDGTLQHAICHIFCHMFWNETAVVCGTATANGKIPVNANWSSQADALRSEGSSEGYAFSAEGRAGHAEGRAGHAEGRAGHAEARAGHAEARAGRAEARAGHAEGTAGHPEARAGYAHRC